MSLLTVIQEYLEETLRHTTMPLTRQNNSSTVFKINVQRARQYMRYNPKRELGKAESDPRQAQQRNLHHLDDHEEFSHLLTSIN